MKILACLILALCVSGCVDIAEKVDVKVVNNKHALKEVTLKSGTRCVIWHYTNLASGISCDFEAGRLLGENDE